MDSSYIESEKKATLVGLWILLFNFLMIFVWLSYEFYAFFNRESDYRWEFTFNIVGIPFGLIFVGLILFAISKKLIKEIFNN